MPFHVTEVMNQVETACQALTDARNHMLRAIITMTAAGHNVSELIRIQERLDAAISSSQTSHDHLAVWGQMHAHLVTQHALDGYTGHEPGGSAQSSADKQNCEFMRMCDDASQRDDAESDSWLMAYLSDDDDDDNPYTRDEDNLFYQYDDDDIESDDESVCDVLDELLWRRPSTRVILGDERASVAFDTSDTTWATQPLHEVEYRMLFGLPMNATDDWHYDIFGNWYPGRYQPPRTDDPDYNIPF